MSNEHRHFPTEPYIKIHRYRGGWIAKLFDFFGELVGSAEAKTRDEARKDANKLRDEHNKKQTALKEKRTSRNPDDRWTGKLGFGGGVAFA